MHSLKLYYCCEYHGCLLDFKVSYILLLSFNKILRQRFVLALFIWGFTQTKMPNEGTILKVKIDETVNYCFFFRIAHIFLQLSNFI